MATKATLLVGCAVLLLAGCGGRSATEPRTTTLLLSYAEPTSFPPQSSGDPFCPHHNAPAFLRVETDWGATGTLLPREGSPHMISFDLPAAGDHWLWVSDYRFCPTGCPTAMTGLSVNGVPLTRTAPRDGGSCPVHWFRVSSNGTVTP